MNHTILTFNGQDYKAKFGLAVIGNTVKDLGISMHEFIKASQENVPLISVALMYNSLKRGNPEEEFTLEEIEDWIDMDGSIASPQLNKFIEAFGASLTVHEKSKIEGKKKTPVKK